MKNIRVIQQTIKEPTNTEVGWLKPTKEGYVLLFYKNGDWVPILGNNNSSSEEEEPLLSAELINGNFLGISDYELTMLNNNFLKINESDIILINSNYLI